MGWRRILIAMSSLFLVIHQQTESAHSNMLHTNNFLSSIVNQNFQTAANG